MLTKPRFIHRRSNDGSWDSICNQCFLTVVSAADLKKEVALDKMEQAHVCFFSNHDSLSKVSDGLR
jgi:hypothetical protein